MTAPEQLELLVWREKSGRVRARLPGGRTVPLTTADGSRVYRLPKVTGIYRWHRPSGGYGLSGPIYVSGWDPRPLLDAIDEADRQPVTVRLPWREGGEVPR